MNKTLLVLALLCGTAAANELTPAQRVEARKFLDRGVEIMRVRKSQLERQWWTATLTLDSKERKRIEFAIDHAEKRMRQIDSSEVPFWNELQKTRRREGLQWQEPKEGEREGRWVPIPEKKS